MAMEFTLPGAVTMVKEGEGLGVCEGDREVVTVTVSVGVLLAVGVGVVVLMGVRVKLGVRLGVGVALAGRPTPMSRILWYAVSATKTLPVRGSMVSVEGELIVEVAHGPSAPPTAPVNATVDTSMPGLIRRSVPPFSSMAYIHPVLFTATPSKPLKAAARPTPCLSMAVPSPATVLTRSVARLSTRRRLLPESLRNKCVAFLEGEYCLF